MSSTDFVFKKTAIFTHRKSYKMKQTLKILIILFQTFVALQLSAQPSIQFSEGNLNAAFEQSKREQKLVCLLCYASWCPHCTYMKESVFNKAEVANYYNKHFICVQQDMEKGIGPELHKKFIITSYPTFIFMDSNQNVIYRTAGEFSVQTFIQEARNALIPEKQLPTLKQKFEADISNSNNCYNYLRALKKGGIDYSDVVTSYFATQSDKQLLSEVNWRIFSNAINDLNTREYQFVLKHLKDYEIIASGERVRKKLIYTAKSVLIPLVEKNDTAAYRINRQQFSDIHSFQIDSLIFTKDLVLYKYNENWTEYQKTTLLSTEKFVWNDYDLLKQIADIYQKNITDTEAITKAIKWIKHSLTLHTEYGSYLIGAKLYRKLNNTTDALSMVKSAEKEAVKYDWNHTEADQLLKELEHK